MPQIQQNKAGDGGKIIWDSDDFVNGLASNWQLSLAPQVRGGNQLSYMRYINPFRRWGFLFPGYRPVNATNSAQATAFIRKGLVDTASAYCITNGAVILKYTIIGNAFVATGIWPYSITAHGGHSTPVANDCVLYNAKVGGTSALQFFYSWSDNTDWDIGVFNLNATLDDDFMSTAPATPLASPYLAGGLGYPHPMIVGDDDLLYVGDRNFLHAYDGQSAADADGKFFPAVLTLPLNWIMTSMQKTNDGLMIFTYYNNQTFGSTNDYRGQARAWEYKYGELDITRSYDLNDNFTSESFALGSTIGVFTYGRQTDPATLLKNSKIQLFDGTKFNVEVSFTGGLPIRGGVEVQNNCIKWNSKGTIYTYGSETVGKKTGLNNIGITSSTAASGMLATFWESNGAIVVSSDTAICNLFQTGSFQEDAAAVSPFAEPLFPMGSKGKIKNVTIEFSNKVTVANSTELGLYLFNENGVSQTILDTFTDVDADTKMIIQRKEDTSQAPLMSFCSVAWRIQFSKASGIATESFTVKRIIIDYDIINSNN